MEKDGVVVCERCLVADRPLQRMRGLLGRKELPEGEGMLLTPERSIHMWFMRFPVDAVFLDSGMKVLGVRENLRPWRVASRRKARSVLELPAGACERNGIREGDRLTLTEREADRASATEDDDRADAESAHVLLLVEDGSSARVVVNGHGSLSAAARTADAIGDLDVPIGVVVLPDNPAAESAS